MGGVGGKKKTIQAIEERSLMIGGRDLSTQLGEGTKKTPARK